MNTSSTTEQSKTINVDEMEMKRLNEEMITCDLITPDKLYLDLALVKDINIGTILSFLKERKSSISQEEYAHLYNQIIENLPKYNERRFDDFEHLFPFMGITNDQIKERLHDAKYASFIFHVAPVTKYVDIIKSQLLVNVNHSAVAGKRSPIEITINTYPLHLSKEDEYIIGFYFANRFKVNVRVVYIDVRNSKLSTMFSFDEVYTYFFKEIFDCEAIRTAYSEMKFVKKRLFVTKLFGEKFSNKDTDQEGLYVQSRMDVLTLFKFVDPRLFSAPPPKVQKENPLNG